MLEFSAGRACGAKSLALSALLCPPGPDSEGRSWTRAAFGNLPFPECHPVGIDGEENR